MNCEACMYCDDISLTVQDVVNSIMDTEGGELLDKVTSAAYICILTHPCS